MAWCVRQQTITCANVDSHLCRHMASLGQNELNNKLVTRVSCAVFCCDYIASFGGYYNDVIMGAIASQITSLTIVYSTVSSGADQSKHQSPASLAFVRGIHRCFHLMTSSWLCGDSLTFVRIALLALRQSYECSSISGVNLPWQIWVNWGII